MSRAFQSNQGSLSVSSFYNNSLLVKGDISYGYSDSGTRLPPAFIAFAGSIPPELTADTLMIYIVNNVRLESTVLFRM